MLEGTSENIDLGNTPDLIKIRTCILQLLNLPKYKRLYSDIKTAHVASVHSITGRITSLKIKANGMFITVF